MANDYRVILSANLFPGKNFEQACHKLAKLMACDLSKIKMLLQKAPVNLKKTMPLELAKQYRAKLEQTGFICKIEAVSVNLQSEKIKKSVPKPVEETSLENSDGLGLLGEPSVSMGLNASGLSLVSHGNEEATGNTMVGMASANYFCPKCNAEQEKSEQCISCGIFFHKYEQQQATANAHSKSGEVLASASGPDWVDEEEYEEEIEPLSSEQVSKLLKNTYALLALTLLFSAFTAYLGMERDLFSISRIFVFIVALCLLGVTWATRNSVFGLISIFAFTGWMGYWIGPIVNFYLEFENGGTLVASAAGMTAMVFFALSAYVLISKRDFNYLETFLFAGLIVCIAGGLLACFTSIPGLYLAASAIGVVVFSGYILYDTGQMINGGETNYIIATVSLYLDVINLFLDLLHLLAALSGED